MHIQTIGLIGILLNAKKKNLITDLKPVLLQLINEAGFYISQSLFEKVLVLAGE